MSLKEIIKLVLLWRCCLVLVAIVAVFLLPLRGGSVNITSHFSTSNLFAMWANFDGRHYLDIAQHGYGYEHKNDADYTFFPLYPVLVRVLNITGSFLFSSLFLSHLFLIIGLFFLVKLVELDYRSTTARSAIVLILLFPVSFFLGSSYAESLFLLLAVLSFLLARKRNFLLAGITAALASATLLSGVFIWPALIYEFWLVSGKNWKKAFHPKALWLLLPPIGLFLFARFQITTTGDSLFFVHNQPSLAGIGTDKLILLHQIFFRYAKMTIFMNHIDPLFFTVLLELLSSLLILIILVLSFKKLRFSYWLFILLSYLLPTFTGTFVSMPRFLLVLFPVFISLAFWLERQHPFIRILYYSTCAVLTILGVIFFTRGYFVA